MAVPHAETVRGRPSPALAPYVEGYLGYRLTGFAPALHRGLPSRRPTFIVSVDDPVDVVAQTDPAQSPARYGTVLSGLQARPALIAHPGHQEGIAIELAPMGFRALFGLPAAALWDVSVELAEVAGTPGAELTERVRAAAGWPDRFAACDDVLAGLLARRDDGRHAAPEVVRAWSRLEASYGTVAVQELAEEVGWSRQHLRRRFTAELGCSPKLAARVIRFDRARRTLESHCGTIAEVAATCGYHDQSHLVHDVAELAGCTPSELIAGDVPFVQDDAVATG